MHQESQILFMSGKHLHSCEYPARKILLQFKNLIEEIIVFGKVRNNFAAPNTCLLIANASAE